GPAQRDEGGPRAAGSRGPGGGAGVRPREARARKATRRNEEPDRRAAPEDRFAPDRHRPGDRVQLSSRRRTAGGTRDADRAGTGMAREPRRTGPGTERGTGKGREGPRAGP